MGVDVVELDDPNEADAQAHEFLVKEPSHHNLALSILAQSCEHRLAGRFWIARADGDVTGFAMQSPPGMRVVLALADEGSVHALADAVDDVPGVQGDAAGAAAFAGRYALRNHVAVTDADAGRLFELTQVEPVRPTPGSARLATAADHGLVTEWVVAFGAATSDPAAARRTADEVAYFISLGSFWMWDDGGPACVVGVKPRVGRRRADRPRVHPARAAWRGLRHGVCRARQSRARRRRPPLRAVHATLEPDRQRDLSRDRVPADRRGDQLRVRLIGRRARRRLFAGRRAGGGRRRGRRRIDRRGRRISRLPVPRLPVPGCRGPYPAGGP